MVTFKQGDIVEIVRIGTIAAHHRENGDHKILMNKPIRIDRCKPARDSMGKKYSYSYYFIDGHFVNNSQWICISPVMLRRVKK